jgi:soluble P-type ATPase
MMEDEKQMTIKVDIPYRGALELQHAVFDINGTLAVDGQALPGIADRLKELAGRLSIHLLSAGTHGNTSALERSLGFPLHIIQRGEEKMRYVQELGPSSVVAIGNGANDTSMLRLAALGIAVLTSEGMALRTLQAADVLVFGPHDAIDLLLHTKRLIATLRG